MGEVAVFRSYNWPDKGTDIWRWSNEAIKGLRRLKTCPATKSNTSVAFAVGVLKPDILDSNIPYAPSYKMLFLSPIVL